MPKPNIIIFNPDQWRGDALGHMGHPAAETPHLDAFVETEAISIAQAHCQNTVCTPSRCSFMTGWYPHTMGHRTMRHILHPERGERSVFQVLREQGYHVWWGGKNDLYPGDRDPLELCDTHFKASKEDQERWGLVEASPKKMPSHEDPTFYSFLNGTVDTQGKKLRDSDWSNIHGAMDFIASRKDDPQPWCIYLPLSYPHPPYQVEQHYYDRIDPTRIPPRQSPDLQDEPLNRGKIRERMGARVWDDEQ